jgi:hypothetical protein
MVSRFRADRAVFGRCVGRMLSIDYLSNMQISVDRKCLYVNFQPEVRYRFPSRLKNALLICGFAIASETVRRKKMRCEYFFIFLLGRIVVVFCFSFMDYMQELEAERAEEEREFEAIDRALEEAGSEDDDLEEGGQHREPGSAVGTPAEHLQQQE